VLAHPNGHRTVVTVDFNGGAVIVTGGTRGLGKAIGLEFSRCGATVFLTHRWGSVDDDELRADFAREGLRPPEIVQSDASDREAIDALMQYVRSRAHPLAAVVSNLAFAKTVRSVDDLKRQSLELSLRYSAWPVVDLLQAARETLGSYPRYAVAISTDGSAVCHPGYDMIGAAKAVLETLVRYLALHLKSEGVRVNAIRCGPIDTQSLHAMFGDALAAVPREPHLPTRQEMMIEPQAVARACVAMCSGLMDSVTGQVLTVDEGLSLVGPLAYLTGHGWPGAFPPDGSPDDPR
jgi:NAD(P)-dependent dehydrogenase (short-subunit alcohol dehydrogenase family)